MSKSTSFASISSTESRAAERLSWTGREDAIIVESVEKMGHKWFRIAQLLPGRTDHAIRNRFHRLKSIALDEVGSYPSANTEVFMTLRRLLGVGDSA